MGNTLQELMSKGVRDNTLTPSTVSNDIVNLLGQKEKQRNIDKLIDNINSTPYGTTTVDYRKPEEFEEYGVSINPLDDDLEKQRARNQSAWEQGINSLAQTAVNEMILGTAIGASDLIDTIGSAIFKSNEDYSNPISATLEEWQEKFRNNTPIYQENPDKSLQFSDFGWWAANAPSIASSISLLIPGVGAVKLASMAGKIIAGTKAAKSISKAAGLAKAKQLLKPSTRETLSHWTKAGATAALSRTMENYREARGVYNDMYPQAANDLNSMSDEEFNKFLNNNPEYKTYENKDDIAKDIAKRSADVTFVEDYANTIFDVIQLHALKNVWKGVRALPSTGRLQMLNTETARNFGKSADEISKILSSRTLSQKAKSNITNFIKGSATTTLAELSEGVEEGINYIAQQEGMTFGNKILGKEVTNKFDDRLASYLLSPELWESAFWGVLGGIVFQGLGSQAGRLANKLTKKGESSESKRREAEILSRNASWNEFVADINKINNNQNIYAVNEDGTYEEFNNEAEKELAKQRRENDLMTKITLNAANAGNLDLLKSYVQDENIKKALIEQGITTQEDADSYIQELLNKIQKVEDLYDKNILYLDSKNVLPEYARIIATENVQYDIENENLDNEITSNDNIINQFLSESEISNNVSPMAQQYIDASVKIARLRYLRKSLDELKNDNTVSGEIGRRNIQQQIEVIENSIKEQSLSTFIMYNSYIKQVDKNKIDNTEAQKYLDKKLEEEYKTTGTPVDKVAVEAELKQHALASFNMYEKVANVKQELADVMLYNSVYKLEKDLNNKAKTVTDSQIKTKTAQLKNTFDEVRMKAVDNSFNVVKRMLDTYDETEVFNYIDRKSKEINNISDEDKKELDDALTILDLTSEDNIYLYSNINRLYAYAVLRKQNENKPRVDGEIIETEPEINPAPETNEIVESETATTTTSTTAITQEPIIEQPVSTETKSSTSTDYVPEADLNESEIENAGTELLLMYKNDNSIDIDKTVEDIINKYVAKGYKKENISKFTNKVAEVIKRKQKSAGITRDSSLSEEFKDVVDDVVLNSAVTEATPSEEYLSAVDNYLSKYAQSIGLKEINGKIFINLESLMRYTKENAADNQLANIIFNNIRDILITESNRNGKYILMDKAAAIRLSREEFLNNANKTSKEKIQEESIELDKQRVDIYSQEETPEYLEALANLQNGQELEYEYNEETAEFDIKSNGVKIGRLPLPQITSTGAYLKYNKGWRYEILNNNGNIQSPLKTLFREWLVDRADEKSVEELNYIINSIAFNDSLVASEKAELIKRFGENKEIINARTKGLIAKGASDETLLDHLVDLYRYLGQQFDNTDRYITINQWFDKLYNSYNGVNQLRLGEKRIVVSDISDGELIKLTSNENIPVKEAIVGFNPKINRLAATMDNNVISVAGRNDKYPFISRTGSTFVLIPNRNGSYEYAQAYPVKTNDNTISQTAKDIKNEAYNSIIDYYKRLTSTDNKISFDEFAELIESLFANGRNSTSLFGNITVTRNKNYIAIGVKNTDLNLVFYDKLSDGKTQSTTIGRGKDKSNVKVDSQTFKDDLKAIFDNANFLISFNGIKSDSFNNYPLNSSVINKTDGKFNITIGDKTWSFESYNDFMLDNNLVKVHIGKTPDGKSNFRRIGIKPGSNQVLNIKIEDKSNSSVEEEIESTASPQVETETTSNKILSILNNSRVKNKGSHIAELLTDKKTKDLFKRLGIISENIIFVDEILDNNGNPINARVNINTGIITVTNRFLAMAETDPQQAFRKLIHESLHNHIAKDKSVLPKIKEIYDEFVESLNDDNVPDNIKRYKLEQYNGDVQLEEFLVESLTSKELANYLNLVPSKTKESDGKSKSLFQKIMEALMKLMGINLNESSLYEKEFLALSDNITSSINEETNIENNEPSTTEFKPNISYNDNGFNFVAEDEEFDSRISEYNNDNSASNIFNFVDGLPLSQQAKISQMLAHGEVNFTCK